MKYLFRWSGVALTFVVALIAGLIVNGNIWGTLYLKELVPGVTIPDITPIYSPQDLPVFFRSMGEEGRNAYITINNLDFVFIFGYSVFALAAFGAMLQYLMKDDRKASRLAWLGIVPGVLDAAESLCFRIIVSNPYAEHVFLSSIASKLTLAKFIAINITLAALLVMFIASTMAWHKRAPSITK